MYRSRDFLSITSADFIARSAYQMGKTPLLPLYAASLGTGDILLGIIVSVSTVTGMFTKPFIGLLSDRWGRRSWLLVGTMFFIIVPFTYRFIDSSNELMIVRLFHGTGTAIYGPVTLAYVAEMSPIARAERFAWFAFARNAGYIVGPLMAGLLLLKLDPISIFSLIGVVSITAIIPIMLLSEHQRDQSTNSSHLLKQATRSLWAGSRTSAVWVAGGIESTNYVALYAVRAFLPAQAIALGMNVVIAGTFFSVQESFHAILNPLGGRLGDRFGHGLTIGLGMITIGAGLTSITVMQTFWPFIGSAIILGIGQALIFPSSLALVSNQSLQANLGLGLGLVGTLKNFGKVLGPIAGGLLISKFGFSNTFTFMAVILALAACCIIISHRNTDRTQKSRSNPSLVESRRSFQ